MRLLTFKSFVYQSLCFYFMTVLLCSAWVAHEALGAVTPQISGLDLVTGKNRVVQLSQAKLGTVVVFLSSKCPCSDSHLPVLNQLAQEFSGFSFVGVHSNANENFEQSLEYFKKSKLTFPVIQDPKAVIADQYEAFKTPHAYVVNSESKILFQGGVDDSKLVEKAKRHFLKEALLAIKNGKEPAEKSVRVVGCEIKRP